MVEEREGRVRGRGWGTAGRALAAVALLPVLLIGMPGVAIAPTVLSRAAPATTLAGPIAAPGTPATAAHEDFRAAAQSHRVTASADQRRARAAAALPGRSGSGRRVVYSVPGQRVWTVWAGGGVDRTYRVSGRPTQPDPGTFRVYSRSRHTASALGAETMEYMIRFTHGESTGAPIGFHSIPIDRSGRPVQTVRQLGQPLSHGCIRQRLADAAYLWRFAPVGTKVVVLR